MIYPAYLFVGNEDEINLKSSRFIKQSLCFNSEVNGCNKCDSCKKFDIGQHHLVRIIKPESRYTTELVDFIFQEAAFALEDDEDFFFILERSDLLGSICGNSLLKILEEPPRGYHFVLLSSNLDSILSTIVSRCIVQNYTSEINLNTILFSYFTDGLPPFHIFSKELERVKPQERDMVEFADQLIAYWSLKYKEYLFSRSVNVQYAQSVLEVLNDVRERLAMPGSAKIFLRDLYFKFWLLKS